MFTITITYDEKDDVLKVDGPIRHPILCYGMLERARDVIKDTVDQRVKGAGIAGSGGMGRLLKPEPSGSA